MSKQIQSARFSTPDRSAIRFTMVHGETVNVSHIKELVALDFVGWLREKGKIEPYYTILDARFANANGTAIECRTVEAGSVVASPDRAELWKLVQVWRDAGGAIEAYELPAVVPARDSLADVEALKSLILQKGVATEAEVEDALNAATSEVQP